jgi:hypothetical protein
MATSSENLVKTTDLFPTLTCCGGALRIHIHLYEDANSWEARCPNCGRVWWLECLGVEQDLMKDVKFPEEKPECPENITSTTSHL